jgi:hypothetical protein
MYIFELSYYLYTEKLKNSRNKYFCKRVSERIGNIDEDKKKISCNKFNIIVYYDKTFYLYLDKNFIANWTYKNGRVTDLSIVSEELFNSFKEIYPRNQLG